MLAASTAFLLLFSFPPFNIWPCGFLYLVPSFFFLSTSTRREAFFLSYMAGIIFFWGSIYWIAQVNLFGCVFLICLFALYWGLYGVLVCDLLHTVLFRHKPIITMCVCAASLSGIEFIRTYAPVFGFGWILPSFSQVYNLYFIQSAAISGALGVTFLIGLINGFLFLIFYYIVHHKKRWMLYAGVLSLIVGCVYWYGYERIRQHPEGTVVRVGIVQGNIPQREKWDPRLKNTIIEKYARLIEFISYDGPDIVILPEASYPGNFRYEFSKSLLYDVIKKTSIPVLLGAIRFDETAEEFNSSFLINAHAEIEHFYDKIQLVPFGEYIPWKPLFATIGLSKVAYSLGVGDFTAGDIYTVFKQQGNDNQEYAFSTLICFEDVFPHLARSFVNHGAQFLVVITNDAWFGDTSAPYQHMCASIFRALENGCYVIRSANTGISAFISPQGRILDTVHDKNGKESFVTGGVSRDIFVNQPKTFYRSMGYLLDYLWVLILLAAIGYIYLSPSKLRKLNILRK